MLPVFSIPPVLAFNEISYVLKGLDPLTRFICVMLILASLAVWAVIFDKVFSFSLADAKNRKFLRMFPRLKHCPAELKAHAESSKSPAAAVYLAACASADSSRQAQPDEGKYVRKFIALGRGVDKSCVNSAMRRTIDRQLFIMKKHTSTLNTLVVGILLLGLAGLVWGALSAFSKYVQGGCDDVRILAAGIPGALLPFSIALFAAVPSFIGSRLVATKVRNVEMQLDSLAEEIRADMAAGQSLCPEPSFLVHAPSAVKEMFVQELLRFLTKPWNRDERG